MALSASLAAADATEATDVTALLFGYFAAELAASFAAELAVLAASDVPSAVSCVSSATELATLALFEAVSA